MAKKNRNIKFDRWKPRSKTSWAFRVYKKHTEELLKMYVTFDNAHRYTYKNLKANKSEWEDQPKKHFKYKNNLEYRHFKDLKDWSKSFNELENWNNLNALIAIASNLETYMATIIPLALESDTGILFGTPKRIDGIEIIKHGSSRHYSITDIEIGCTKGTWESRLNSYKKAFGYVPEYLIENISLLEKIRKIRNDVAHAFGRDIEASRKNNELTKLPIAKLTREKFLKLEEVTWKSAVEIDKHLNANHIGEFEAILFYHKMYPSLNKKIHSNERAQLFKKKLGQFGDAPPSKEFCKDLVIYYEKL